MEHLIFETEGRMELGKQRLKSYSVTNWTQHDALAQS